MKILLITLSLIIFETAYSQNSNINPVPFNQVQLSDNFWAPRIETNRTVSIPSAFRKCEENGRFDNFALAGGIKKCEHQGDFPFDDTDPYKIIEGASYALAVKYDKKLDAYLDSVIHLIEVAQEPDGYLTTCVTNKCTRLSGWWGNARWEKINSHELYNSGHLYEAAVAHFQSTGKRTLLNVAIKNADLVCQVFGPNTGQIHRPSGHPIIEMGLAKLYKVTGNQKYIEMAKYFVEETGRGTDGHHLSEYSQDHEPILQQKEIKGHAVRAGYLFSGVADVAALTNDTTYFNALMRIWENMASRKLYITGGIGSRAQGEGFGPDYELPNHTAYCETCASIANVYWNQRMFQATGDTKYIDVLERALYNGVISGVSLSGDKFFYDNPLESMGQHERQPWFGCACCPGNITRFMASVPGYMYATDDKSIYINLYAQSKANVLFGKNKIEIKQETTFPNDGYVKFFIFPSKTQKFTLKFRIPGWAENSPVPTDLYFYSENKNLPVEILLNGIPVHTKKEKGYLSIIRKWQKGDKLELKLPMEIHKVFANAQVEDDKAKMAFERGPIVYCLEAADQPDKLVFDKYISKNAVLKAEFRADLLNGITVLKGTAHKVQKTADGISETEVPFTAVPYSVWNNRGTGEMAVWIPYKSDIARPQPEPTIASRARCVNTYGVNDQWEPKSSADISKPYHYWWLKKGVDVELEYTFDKPETVQNVQVYWLSFDHYDGNYRVPESWKLFYKADNEWKEVDTDDYYTTLKDCYNSLNFKKVTTTGLKITAKLQKGQSGGVIEWKVK